MPLWQWTLCSLGITAILGLILFCGYTFRVRIFYPFALVTGHVVSATITMVLFCILQYHVVSATGIHMYALVISWVSFATLIITFLTGLYFYLWFNARRRGLRNGMLVTHLIMAALSFSFAISGVAGLAGTQTDHAHYFPPTMYNYHKHHRAGF